MELPKHFVFFELNYFYLTASATALNGFPADIPIETIASSLADTADVEKVQQQMQQKRAERLSADRNGTIVTSDKSSNSQGKHFISDKSLNLQGKHFFMKILRTAGRTRF